ncbi:Radical SAM superfamily protein [Streptococcus thermophilus CNCM I-1630]|nr:Radical SAM superfamily protein [Streptococcus thermophilus CNCM I-1630]
MLYQSQRKNIPFCLIQRIIWRLKLKIVYLKKLKLIVKLGSNFIIFFIQENFYQERNELEEAVQMFRDRDVSTLRIIILAHGDCNFRCKYCYEKFVDCTIESQKSSILKFVKNKFEQYQFKDIHVSWFGGEPLLGYRDILDISKALIELSSTYGIRYHSDMTTNGYLLNSRTLSRLVTECQVQSYQITVDGTKEGHDNQRVLKNGHGSYDRIIKNLSNAQKLDLNFHILIRLNVSKENYSDVENFLVTDAQLFKRDKRFQLLFRNVGDWGCGDRKEGYEVKRFAEDVSFELSQKEHTYTIDTKGNLLKCTVALYDEENKIGNLDSFVIDDQKQKLWINNYEFSQKCSKYQLLLICKGGACPKRDIFNERTFNEKCQRMRQNILQNFELAILSNKVNYKLKVE